MSTKRIAVLVSGGGTNLQALIDAQQAGKLQGGEIVAVLSSKAGAYALERAAKAGIPGYVVARKDFDSNQAMTLALVEKLKTLSIDLVVLAGFMHILTSEMVAAYPNAILNVHPALIPSFCGKAVAVQEGDTPEILQRRVMEEAEWLILPQAVSLFCQDRLTVEGRIVHIKEV